MIFFPELHGIQVLVYGFGRYIDSRLGNEDLALGDRWKSREFFPDSLGKGGPSHQAVWDIRPKLYSPLHQLLFGKPQAKHFVNAKKHGRGIAAPPCHAGRHGDKLPQADGKPRIHTKFFHQKRGGPVGQILLIVRQIIQVALHSDSLPCFPININAVMKAHCLHNHPYLMIAVLPLSQDI